MLQPELESIAVPEALSKLRRFPMDRTLLLFDRDSGLNALCEGPETAHLRLMAPRVVQFGITNRCNLACTFCSRDLTADSAWTFDSAFTFLAELANWGVLEVAFGGGEPWLFPDFADLINRLYDQTPLAINFTTNGLALSAAKLSQIRGKYGQIRLSLYDNNDWRQKVAMLVQAEARFGVNYLVTPMRLAQLEKTVFELTSLGCRDILLLSYNGADHTMHLSTDENADLRRRIAVLAKILQNQCQLKLDVCWGERMAGVDRLFEKNDCGAGREFIVLTSEKQLQPCSFHQLKIPVVDAKHVMDLWHNNQEHLHKASVLPGCARLTDYGLALAEQQ